MAFLKRGKMSFSLYQLQSVSQALRECGGVCAHTHFGREHILKALEREGT